MRARLIGRKPWWVLLPDHWLVAAWQPFMFLPLMYVAVVTPYRIFFSHPDTTGWLVVEYFVWVSFLLDMALHFVTAFADDHTEEIVVDPRAIALRYVKSWFIIDLLASIPFDLILRDEEGGATSANRLGRLARLPRAIRVLRLLRLLRLLRVVRLQGYLTRFEALTDLHPAIARAFAATFWVVLSLHFMACLWFFIGSEQGGDNWMTLAELDAAPNDQLYLVSLYWVATTITSVGYGDIVPATDSERMFAVFVQLVGVAWTGLVVSTMANIQASVDREHSTTKQHRRQLEYFVRDARLPRKLKARVFQSFERAEHDAARASAQHTAAILDMLAPAVRKEVVLFTNRKLLHMLPPLRREEEDVQAFVVERLVRMHVSQGDFVCVEHTFATHMFWMARGRVNLFSDTDRVTSYGSGSFFGVADVLFSPLRVASAQAVTDCELYSLSREHLQVVCSEFEDFGRRMRRVALKRLRRYAEVLGRPLVPAEYLQRMMELGVSVGLTAEEVAQYAAATSLDSILAANPAIMPSASFRIGASSSSAAEQLTLDPRAFVGDVEVRSTRTLLGGRDKATLSQGASAGHGEGGGGGGVPNPLRTGVTRRGSRVLGEDMPGGPPSPLLLGGARGSPQASPGTSRASEEEEEGGPDAGPPPPSGRQRGRARSVSLGNERALLAMGGTRGVDHILRSPSSTRSSIASAASANLAAAGGMPVRSPAASRASRDRQLAAAEAAARVMAMGGTGGGGGTVGGRSMSASTGGWTPALMAALASPAPGITGTSPRSPPPSPPPQFVGDPVSGGESKMGGGGVPPPAPDLCRCHPQTSPSLRRGLLWAVRGRRRRRGGHARCTSGGRPVATATDTVSGAGGGVGGRRAPLAGSGQWRVQQ